MPLIKIEHHHHERHICLPDDPNLVHNERTKLAANFLMSMAYVTATAAVVGLTARIFSSPSDTKPGIAPFALEASDLNWVVVGLALTAAVFIGAGLWILGRLR